MVYANHIPGQALCVGAAGQHKMDSLFCFGVLWTTGLFFGEKGGREMGITELGEEGVGEKERIWEEPG